MICRARPVAVSLFVVAAVAACNREPARSTAETWPAQPPMRIVAGSVLAAEVLLEIAPRERLAGVHAFAADPKYSLVVDAVRDLPKVGAEPEQLLAVRPDLVILDAFTRPETQVLLESADVHVVRTLTPSSFADIETNIRRIGRACHLDGPADALVARMNGKLRDVQQRGADLGVWHVMNLDGGLHTHGRGSLFDAMVHAAGAHNLAAERGAGPFRKLSLEAVLSWRADALIVDVEASQPHGGEAWLDQVPGLHLLPCAVRGHVLFVPGAMLGTTSHRLVDTAEFLQAALRKWGRP